MTFGAPLPFVYRWCTTYTSRDGRYSGERYERRVLRRSLQRVEFEDLYDTAAGWIWIHREVSLHPPTRWHAESIGSDRALSVDYRLTKLPDDGTALTIRATRRPYGIGRKNPPNSKWESDVAKHWKGFARALERDYQRLRHARQGE